MIAFATATTTSSTFISQVATNARQYRQQLVREPLKLALVLLALALVFLPSGTSFAAAIDPTKLKAGSAAVISGIQTVCVVAVPVLFVAGFGTVMFGGISENLKRVAIRIIGFAFVGAVGLFLFAQPLSDLVIGAVSGT